MKIRTSRTAPEQIESKEFAYPFSPINTPFPEKKTGKLPAMGWNSWNAFGSGNTEALTKIMADKMLELGLDKLGYEYLVLDDGCYKQERVDGKLSNEEVKFPNGFRALSDYVHSKGLKFGMYNDIGTNLCAGAAVGTCGHEDTDAKSYVEWGVDFLKVDNCYYLWDNATFSNAENAKYSFAPNIKSISVSGKGLNLSIPAVNGTITGQGPFAEGEFVTNIGTFDGTNTGTTPVGERSGELVFEIEVPASGDYGLTVEYQSGKRSGCGEWLQVAVGKGEHEVIVFDDLLPEAENIGASAPIPLSLKAGKNLLRLMNHRRQENTLISYSAMFYALQNAAPSNDIQLSICEWGKTHPQNWGYKVGNSWRILNDITFCVGRDGDPGKASWDDPGTCSIVSQYNKGVIMDEFASPVLGWNDPDMMVIGMNEINESMNRTHMAMWCMMNSPLMLGLDLRRVTKNDWLYRIIANEALINLNQDPLGVQAKRVYSSILENEAPDTTYITNNDRVDILAKPLADGDLALSFINLSRETKKEGYSIDLGNICSMLKGKFAKEGLWDKACKFQLTDLWSGEITLNTSGVFSISEIAAFDNVTIRIKPISE